MLTLMDKSNISIIIVNLNGRDLIEDCLTSIEKLTLRAREIIIIDNGSIDGSVEFVNSNFPLIKVIRLDRNQGFARAANIGIKRAKGSRIALLNNDTVVDEKWLQELNYVLDKNPEVGFCASKILNYWDPKVIDTAGDVLGIFKAYKRGHMRVNGAMYSKQLYVFGACAGAAIYRRDMLNDIGLFDENFVSDMEDVDISFRAQLTGYRCMYVPTAIVYHKMGQTKNRIGWTGQLTLRNNMLVWLKNAPAGFLIKYAPEFFYEETIRCLICFGIRRHGFQRPNFKYLATILKAYGQALRLIPKILRQRRRIQRRKIVNAKYIESHVYLNQP